MVSNPAPRFSPASLRCSRALPGTVMNSSAACGWTSVLLEHHRVVPDGEPFETGPTPDQTVVVMLRGEQDLACFRAGAWRHAAYRAGTVGLTQGGQTDRLRRRPRRGGEPFEKVNLYVPEQIMREAGEHTRRIGQRASGSTLVALAFRDPLVAQTATALLRGMAVGQPDLYAQAAVHWLAVHLVSTHGRGNGSVCGEPFVTDKRLARALEYMSAHLSEALTLDELAAEAGISKFHFTRAFRQATGLTPYEHLIGLRMEAACTLLAGSDLNVAEVAARCGYTRATQFSAVFAARVGLTPTAYRRSKER